MGQKEMWFFHPQNGTPPSPEYRKSFLDPENPNSPYFGFIGNKRAIDKLVRIDFQMLGRYNHQCNDLSVAFIGEAGCGKTELAHRHAKANGLPTVEISPKAIKKVQDIFDAIQKVCNLYNIPLVEVGHYDHYWIPPMNIFIDEVHALAQPIVQGLLKATEHNDATMVTERNIVCDCKRIHWIIATTDRGKLFDAFDTRFSKIVVNLYTKEEIAEIINYVHDLDIGVCQLVAHYCGRVPREALAFTREMCMEREMHPHSSWEEIAAKVAEDNEIDRFGMTYKRLAILKALGQGPIAEKRLPIVAGVKADELNKFIMPWLMSSTDDQQAMVTVSHRGYSITMAGVEQLNIRNISHKGDDSFAA